MSTKKMNVQQVKITYVNETEVQYQQVVSVTTKSSSHCYIMKMRQDGKVYRIMVPYVNIKEIIEEWGDEA